MITNGMEGITEYRLFPFLLFAATSLLGLILIPNIQKYQREERNKDALSQCTQHGVNFFIYALKNIEVASRYITMRWRKHGVLFHIGWVSAVHLSVVSADQEKENVSGGGNCKQTVQKLSPQVMTQVILHGFLLWASMGFLTPLGILIIQMNNRLESGRKRKILYYIHLVTQVCSAVLVTIAASLSIKNFENIFNNSHQRMGLALYIAVWLQSLTGFFRPKRGTNGRSVWFFVHWILGTLVSFLGIISVYSGLQAYHTKTFRSAMLWTALFTAEMVLVAFGYLLQDKWEYTLKQGVMTNSVSTMPAVNKQFLSRDGRFKQETQP